MLELASWKQSGRRKTKSRRMADTELEFTKSMSKKDPPLIKDEFGKRNKGGLGQSEAGVWIKKMKMDTSNKSAKWHMGETDGLKVALCLRHPSHPLLISYALVSNQFLA